MARGAAVHGSAAVVVGGEEAPLPSRGGDVAGPLSGPPSLFRELNDLRGRLRGHWQEGGYQNHRPDNRRRRYPLTSTK